MTRMRTDVAARASNNIYTALSGSACVAVLIALGLVYFRWKSLTNEPLFFGIF
jgi:hypothetical protein